VRCEPPGASGEYGVRTFPSAKFSAFGPAPLYSGGLAEVQSSFSPDTRPSRCRKKCRRDLFFSLRASDMASKSPADGDSGNRPVTEESAEHARPSLPPLFGCAGKNGHLSPLVCDFETYRFTVPVLWYHGAVARRFSARAPGQCEDGPRPNKMRDLARAA